MADLETGEIVSLKKQLAFAIEQGDEAAQGAAQDSLGAAYIALGKNHDAIKCYKQAARIAVELGTTHAEARAYYNIGNANSSLGVKEEAIEYYEKCLIALNGKGDPHFIIGQYQGSGSYLEKCHGFAIPTNDSDLVIKLRNIANVKNKLGKYQEALECYSMCLEYAVKSEDTEAQKALYCDIGVIAYEARDYHESVRYFKKYLEMTEISDDKRGEVVAYSNLGNANFCLEDHGKAIRCHEKCLSIATELDYKYGQQCAYQNMGRAYDGLGRHERAIELYNKCLAIASDIGDKGAETKAYANLGDACSALGNYQKAIEYHKKSLDASTATGDRNAAMVYCEKLAFAYLMSGDLSNAIKYYEGSFLCAEKVDKEQQRRACIALVSLNVKVGEYQEAIEKCRNYIQIVEGLDRREEANGYCNLGNLHLMTGQYSEAFDGYQTCIEIALEIKDMSLVSTALCNLGNVDQAIGNSADASENHKRSVDIAIESGDSEAEVRSYCILGHLSYQSKLYNESIGYLEKYLQAVLEKSDKKGELLACRNLGSAYLALGKHQEAINFHERSVEIAVELGDKQGEGRAYEYIGYSYASSKDYLKSIENHEKQLEIAKDVGDKIGAGKANNRLGGAYFARYLMEKDQDVFVQKAISYLEESISCYDEAFENISEYDHCRIFMEDQFLRSYEMLLEVLIEMGKNETALIVSERKRGRALEDILALKHKAQKTFPFLHNFITSNSNRKLLLSESCILFFSQDRLRLTRHDNVLTVGSWIIDLNNEVSFHCYDFSEDGSIDEDILNSENILQRLVNKSYVSMSARGEGACENRSFSINDDSTAQSSLEVQSTCARSGKRNTVDEEFDGDYLEILFDALITPIKHMLTQDEIIIVPDGPLFKVPFAALRDREEGKYWSETKRIRIVPSLTTLTILKDSSADLNSLRGALIIGDPDVEGKRMLKDTTISFSALPNARREAEEIAKVLGVNALVGEQATKQVVMERLREGVAVIHFAAHGCADSGEIVLSPPESLKGTQTIPSEDDYLLKINEVQFIGIRARLVVLSCCHSGRGEIKSEGVIGMSRAFLAAGALAVVASLWAVDDLGTKVFMQKFYEQLNQGKSASRSLQQAKNEMLADRSSRYTEPSFWAPFVLIGEDVTIKVKNS